MHEELYSRDAFNIATQRYTKLQLQSKNKPKNSMMKKQFKSTPKESWTGNMLILHKLYYYTN